MSTSGLGNTLFLRMSSDNDENLFDDGDQSPVQSPVDAGPAEPPTLVPLPLYPAPKLSPPVYLFHLPKYLELEPQLFDEGHFRAQLDPSLSAAEQLEEKRVAMATLRWRYHRDGNALTKQLNAHVVEWDDGEFLLVIGSELFDLPRRTAHDTVLVVAREAQEVLQTQAVFAELMSVVPASANSQTHARLTAAVAGRARRTDAVKNVVVEEDPDKAAREFSRAENERWRSRQKLEKKRMVEVGRGSRGETPDVVDELSESDMEGFIADDYEESEEDEGEERLREAKRRRVIEEEED